MKSSSQRFVQPRKSLPPAVPGDVFISRQQFHSVRAERKTKFEAELLPHAISDNGWQPSEESAARQG
jgi:hypothetical protein